MKNYEMNLDNANSEVLKWLNNQANKRIHQTTLEQPFKLLVVEQPHLYQLPKPYIGIHPKIIGNSIVKNGSTIKSNIPISVISIPNRDLNDYDNLIPLSMAFIMPMVSFTGVSLWN